MTKLLLTAAAVLTLAGAAHAAPAADNDRDTKVVSTVGVNFSDAAQARRFYVKLYSAAQSVCGHSLSGAELSCVQRNLVEATQKIDAPQLTAMLNNSFGPQTNTRAFAADAR